MLSEQNQSAVSVTKIAQAYHDNYSTTFGLGSWSVTKREYARIDVDRGSEIGAYYDCAPTVSRDISTTAAYHQFSHEVSQQYQWAKILGLQFTHQRTGPYHEFPHPSLAMALEVEKKGRLRVYQGGEPHPFLNSPNCEGITPNEQFRAVHDLFGHALESNSFGPLGEERAWLSHARFFGPLALQAMTTETRGQNCWVNFGPHMFHDAGWLPPRFFYPSL